MFNICFNSSQSNSVPALILEVEDFYNLYRLQSFDQKVLERLAKVNNRCFPHLSAFQYLAKKDPEFCKRLIEYVVDQHSDVVDWNLKSTDRLLSDLSMWAMEHDNLGICRWVIDQGGVVSVEVHDWIAQKLRTRASPVMAPLFFHRRPKIGIIERYHKQEGFSPLKSRPLFSNWDKQPIALIHIAAHDQLHKLQYYGAITAFLSAEKDNCFYISDFYKQLADQFTVLRVLVSDKEQFIPILKKVKKLLPNKIIAHWMLNGHGNHHAIGLREGVFRPSGSAFFRDTDTTLMRKIAEQLGEQSTISLLGCDNAAEEENMTRVFSKHSQGIPVAGCSGGSVVRSVHIWEGKVPALFPRFDFSRPDTGLVVYKNGERILDEKREIRSKL